MARWLLIWAAFLFYAAAIGAAWLMKALDLAAFIYGVLTAGLFFGVYVVLYLTMPGRKEAAEAVRRLHEVYEQASIDMQAFPGGTSLEWDKGRGSLMKPKLFTHPKGKEEMRVMALRGHDEEQNLVIVYFDTVKWRAWGFDTPRDPKIISNPFHEFDPYSEETRARMLGSRLMRTGKKRGFTFSLSEGADVPDDDDDGVADSIAGRDESAVEQSEAERE